MYELGPLKKHRDSQAVEAYLVSGAKEKGTGLQGSGEGQGGSQEDEKINVWYTDVSPAMPPSLSYINSCFG